MKISSDVQAALTQRRAVVALESSVLAQGLPHPHNEECAWRCAAAVRERGGVAATIAIIDGDIHVGLPPALLQRLTQSGGVAMKIAARDVAVAVAKKSTGGTTVSATCEIAAAAGIAVFATGGIGGVHRGASTHFDVSPDLAAIAKSPVAVVCAGAKSVLDVAATLEQLETLGVPVIGVGTDDFPGFYTRSSGLKLEHRVENAEEAAHLFKTRRLLGQGGVIFAVPPPAETALGFDEVEHHLKDALVEAERHSVRGKAVTPFLLKQMAERLGNKTLQANLALLENNARFAAELAVECARGKQ
ncbi:MAG: pseudouridine-5'-phosphate glycosidase [Archangiaceae bacterium]|nr:pseudouridine-5'-phosphate glycosidase [Archangiaceae bacterium]